MKIIVNKDNVKIVNKPTLHKGEYGVHKCEFEFSSEYDGLVKVAVFRHQTDYETYKVDVVNNTCDIPTEVLDRTGQLFLGVYAYNLNGEVLELRYSPNMDVLNVAKGSYTENGKTPTEVTPTQYEMYSNALNDGLNTLNVAINQLEEDKANGVFNGKDGKDGAKGEDGSKGEDGKDGETPVIGDNGNWYIGGVDTGKPSRGEKGDPGDGGTGGTSDYAELTNKPKINNVELNGNKTLNDLGIQVKGDYVTTTELNNKGYSTFSGDYNDLKNKPTIPVIPSNVSAFTNDVGYLTEHQDISGKADKTYVDNAIANAIGSALGGSY